MKKLNINSIRIDGGTQSRVEINNETVSDYAEAVKVGIEFPPVVVFHDGADNWLADGFHRFHAHKHAGKASIAADILQGSVRDAILYSLAANGTHGLRRSNADKRKSVQTLLTDPEWSEWSDRKIADACGVTHPFVANLRRPAVVTVTTPEPVKSAPKVVTVTAPAAKTESPKSAKRELPVPQEPAHDEQIAEAQHTIAELAQENEQLRDKLAVESLMDSESAKTQTSETIRELRALVKTLEAENAALKVSRDTYQREASESKKSAIYWRKQAEKAAKDSA
jgi:ParB-like chromosome segregation protein Spo0J